MKEQIWQCTDKNKRAARQQPKKIQYVVAFAKLRKAHTVLAKHTLELQMREAFHNVVPSSHTMDVLHRLTPLLLAQCLGEAEKHCQEASGRSFAAFLLNCN